MHSVLDDYVPQSDQEIADIGRLRALAGQGDVWARSLPVHVTGSAVIVHPGSQRVLLRWHQRQQAWLQVGGHADPGESHPFEVAVREAREETGLTDLAAWPDRELPRVIQIAILPVPAGRGEPAHEHADVRYVLRTDRPDAARPESAVARLRWLPLAQAIAEVSEDNLRTCLQRVAALIEQTAPASHSDT